MRILKPLAAFTLIGVAIVAFGFAGQHALSETSGGSNKGSCSTRGLCGSAKALPAARTASGGECSDTSAAKQADLSTREGRRSQVMAEYAALTKTDAEGCTTSGCGSYKAASIAKSAESSCGAAAIAGGSGCGSTKPASGVHAAIADMKAGNCALTSGRYGPAVTAAVMAAVYAVAQEEGVVPAVGCGTPAAASAEGVCPVAMAKHGQSSETAARAAVEAVRAINRQDCPYLAIAAVLPAGGGPAACSTKESCGTAACGSAEECLDEAKACASEECDSAACEIALTARLSQ